MVALRLVMGPMACLISHAEIGNPSAGQGFGGPGFGSPGFGGHGDQDGQGFGGGPGSGGLGGGDPYGSGGLGGGDPYGGSPGFGGDPEFGGHGSPGFGGPGSGGASGLGGPGFGGGDQDGAGFGGSPGYGGPAGGSPGFGGGPGYGGDGGQGFGGPGYGGPGGSPGFGGPGGGDPYGRSPGFGGGRPGFGGPGGGEGFGGPGFDGPGGPGFEGGGGPGFDGSGGGAFGPPGPPPSGCPSCNFNIRVLEAFTQDFTVVSVEGSVLDATTSTLHHATNGGLAVNGTIALDVRHMQAELTLHEEARDDPRRTVDWDLLVNGASQMASLHISSVRVNACLSVTLPPRVRAAQAQMDQQLQMMEQMAPMIAQQVGHQGTVDGDAVVVLTPPVPPQVLETYDGPAVDIDNQTSHLALIRFARNPELQQALAPLTNRTISQLGAKFSNYGTSPSFADVGCTIAGQTAAQELLADPEARAHFEGRLRQFEQHVVAFRSIAPVDQVFAAVPGNLLELFLPESAARSDLDMLEKVSDNRRVHSWALGSVVLGLTAAVAGVLFQKTFRGKPEVDVYENLDA